MGQSRTVINQLKHEIMNLSSQLKVDSADGVM